MEMQNIIESALLHTQHTGLINLFKNANIINTIADRCQLSIFGINNKKKKKNVKKRKGKDQKIYIFVSTISWNKLFFLHLYFLYIFNKEVKRKEL